MNIPHAGQPADIQSGAFSGFSGTICTADAERAEVEVILFGRAVRVQVALADLRYEGQVDAAVLDVHLGALGDDRPERRVAAAAALGALGSAASGAGAALAGVLSEDRRAEVREAAAAALGRIDAAAAWPALCRAASDRSFRVRAAVLRVLGSRSLLRLGEPAIQAAVRRGLADPDPRVQQQALRALAIWDDPESGPALLRLLEAGATLEVRRCAALALARQGAAPAGALPLLVRLAADLRTDPRMPDTAHFVLGRLGATAALTKMLDDADSGARCLAAAALATCRQEASMPAVAAALERAGEDWERRRILHSIGEAEEAARSIAPAVARQASHPGLAQEVVEALDRISGIEALFALTMHTDEPVRRAALHALAGRRDLPEERALLVFTRALSAEWSAHRRSAARALACLRDRPGVEAALQGALARETDALTRETIAQALA